ncbi:putative cytosol aminopeptidase [Bienertia sinuspersici]
MDNLSHPIILVDGSWSPIDNNAGSAWVLSASPHRGGALFSKVNSAFQAEAVALLHALIWARHLGFCDLIVYTDSSLLISALQQRTTSNDSIWVLQDILHLGCHFNTCKILKVSRLLIQPAHDQAHDCRYSSLSFQSL